jgi:exodeoxyribonuclease-3
VLRVATWNVNSLNKRLPRVEEWLAYAQPDVLCMQETKVADSAFPSLAFQALARYSRS